MKNLNEIEEMGYCSFKDGVNENNNPFSVIDDDSKHCAWLFGWKTGELELSSSTKKGTPKVNLITDKNIDHNYGFQVAIEDKVIGSIVGFDSKSGLLFKPNTELNESELMSVIVAIKLKEMELSKAGLFG
jgi:hypothetical protein